MKALCFLSSVWPVVGQLCARDLSSKPRRVALSPCVTSLRASYFKCPHITFRSGIALVSAPFVALLASNAVADFTMNFVPDYANELPGSNAEMSTIYSNTDNKWGDGRMGGWHLTGEPGTDPQTPWLLDWTKLERPQIVTHPVTGDHYYHMLFGDLGSGFMQESYILMGLGGYGNYSEPANAASASGGTGTYISRSQDRNTVMLGNGYDPLDMDNGERGLAVESGNGTANPKRVIFRQIVADGEIMMEVHKDSFLHKPRISQMVMGPDIAMMFDIDLRSMHMDDTTSSVPVYNTIELWGEGTPWDGARFDVTAKSHRAFVSAGHYRYVEGSGFGGSEGTYIYNNGEYDIMSVSWADYFDKHTYNPWAFEDAKIPVD